MAWNCYHFQIAMLSILWKKNIDSWVDEIIVKSKDFNIGVCMLHLVCNKSFIWSYTLIIQTHARLNHAPKRLKV